MIYSLIVLNVSLIYQTSLYKQLTVVQGDVYILNLRVKSDSYCHDSNCDINCVHLHPDSDCCTMTDTLSCLTTVVTVTITITVALYFTLSCFLFYTYKLWIIFVFYYKQFVKSNEWSYRLYILWSSVLMRKNLTV